MRDKFILVIFVLISLNCFAQEFDFKAPKDINLKITTMDKYYKDSHALNDTIAISNFDSNGDIIKTVHYYNNLINSCSSFKYDYLKQLIELKDYGVREYQLKIDSVTGQEIEISEYDSTATMQIKKYSYKDGLLRQIDFYELGQNLIQTNIYDYDNFGRKVKELKIFNPDSNAFVHFKPNSTEIDWNHPRQKYVSIQTKKCKYSNNLRLCEYLDSANVVSIDTTFYVNDLIKRNVIYRKSGEKIFEALYDYDDNSNLIESRKYDSGKSAYGGENDKLASNRIKYYYNNQGYLITKEFYLDNEILTKLHYQYIKN